MAGRCTEPPSRKRWGGSGQGCREAWTLVLNNRYTVQNRGLLYYFCSLWQNCPSHHNIAFDLNAVEKCSRVVPKPHNYVSWHSLYWENCNVCWKCRFPGHSQNLCCKSGFHKCSRENEAQLWKPVSCRHLGNWKDSSTPVFWERNMRLPRSCLWHEKWACSPRRKKSQLRLPCWVLSNERST